MVGDSGRRGRLSWEESERNHVCDFFAQARTLTFRETTSSSKDSFVENAHFCSLNKSDDPFSFALPPWAHTHTATSNY